MWPVRTCFNWYVITWSGKAGLKQLKLKWTVECFVMVSLCIFPEENMINPSCSTSAKISKHALVVFLPILQYNPYEKQFVIDAPIYRLDKQKPVWSCHMVEFSCRHVLPFFTYELFYQSSFQLEQPYQQWSHYAHLSHQNFLNL